MARREGWRTGGPLLVLALLVSGARAAGASGAAGASLEGAGAEREAAVAELLPALDELARWCQKSRLYGKRERIYAAILHFDPDRAGVRRKLGYRKRDGGWWRGSHRTPRDRNPGALEEYERRMSAILEAYRGGVAGLLADSNAFEETGGADPFGVWTDILALDPDDAQAHAALGEVRGSPEGEAPWVLRETAIALQRREEARRCVRRALATALPIQNAEGLECLDDVGLTWSKAVVTEGFVVSGTASAAEIEDCARTLRALEGLLRLDFPDALGLPGDLVVYVLKRDRERRRFLSAHASSNGRAVEAVSEGISLWVPGKSRLLITTLSRSERLEHLVRRSIALFLRHSYDLSDPQGWAFEGTGIVLGDLVLEEAGLGARDKRSPEHAPSGRRGMRRSHGSGRWWGQAAVLLEAERPRGLSELARKPAASLEPADLVVSSTLVRYLLEAWPGKAHEVFANLEREVPLEGTLRRALGMDLETLDLRLRRWIEETAGTMD